MPPSDDRYAPTIRASKEGEHTPSLQHLNEELRKLYAYVQVLEGRLGVIKLRDVVSCPGLTVDSTLFPELDGELDVQGGGLPLFRATSTGFSRGCRIYNSIAIATVSGVSKLLTFDSERFDVDGMHNATNPSRITVGVPGRWLLGAAVSFTDNAAGFRSIAIGVTRAGVQTIVGTAVGQAVVTAGQSTRVFVVTLWDCVVGDYAEVMVNQDSGAPLDVLASVARSPEFWAWQVG